MKCKQNTKVLIYLIIIIAVINIIYCKYIYGQGLLDGLIGIYYIVIFMAYFMFYKYYMKNISGIHKTNLIILQICTIVAVLSLMQSILFPHFNIFQYSFRNGNIRIYGTAMSYFAEIIAIAYLIGGYATRKMKIQLAILIITLIKVSQSRGGILLLFIAGFVAMIKKLLDKPSKRNIAIIGMAIVLVGIGIMALSKTSYWNELFSFTTEIQDGTGSGATRMNELEYFYYQARNSFVFGLGLLRGDSYLANQVFRLDLHYYIEDLGLLGTIFQTGLIGCIWIILFLFMCLKKIKKLYHIKNYQAQVIQMVLIMLVITSIIGITNANYILSKTSILFVSMILAQADVLIKSIEES